MKDQIVLVVHGHFYQPPRENPWTDEVDDDSGAAPFANWNARINAECYRSNAYARVHDGRNRIAGMANNFSHMSFNIGPTLGRWLDRNDSQVSRRIREGDAEQRTRLSAGGAMAQVWAHPIAPLLSRRDLQTQIRWGICDFRRRFGYDPSGMWLPETAANEATLGALIDAGIAFTIVAPEQVKAVRAPGGQWQEVTSDSVDTGRCYKFFHPDGSGRSLALCVFDGPLSRDLAFGGVTRDASSFLAAVHRSAGRSRVGGKRLVLAASDGELYGHHKKFADLMLAYALGVAGPAQGIRVTNLQAFLAESPPSWEARLHHGHNGEGTAWSCSHGLGRWMRDCGCRISNRKGSTQAWRTPLRQALDLLRDRAAEFFASAAADLFSDPWQIRNDYGEVVDDDFDARSRFLQNLVRESAKQAGASPEAAGARGVLLMEMQRSLLLMYASCAWFFDDIAGCEPVMALRRAAHAMDLWKRLGGQPPESDFLERLAQARSNDPRSGTGRDVFVRAERARVTASHVVAAEAFRRLGLTSRASEGTLVPGFSIRSDAFVRPSTSPLIEGRVEVVEPRLGPVGWVSFSARCHEGWQMTCDVDGRQTTLDDLHGRWARTLRLGILAKVADGRMEARTVRALLDGVERLGQLTKNESALLAGPIARALASYLEAFRLQGKNPDEGDAGVMLKLMEAARAAQDDDLRRLEDCTYEHLEQLRRRHVGHPKVMQMLVERIAQARAAIAGRGKG